MGSVERVALTQCKFFKTAFIVSAITSAHTLTNNVLKGIGLPPIKCPRLENLTVIVPATKLGIIADSGAINTTGFRSNFKMHVGENHTDTTNYICTY
ncbi:hypothetical protein PR048_013718 [Dryococelus australis]|uniref:Uncharacterized protein n=1 Tax=Dryococelus australis TaxID=614101 RepID=A0ABQ9HSZ8_9NEOP|nr:hypothetical protein PR048_013718 [Dryococelus australis]